MRIIKLNEDLSNTDKIYFDLVKDLDSNKNKIKQLIQESALNWGAVEKNGKPLLLYHGTNKFGFTKFNTDIIFVTDNKSTAAGYGKTWWANKRKISDKYIDDDGTDDTLVKNARVISNRNVRRLNKSDLDSYIHNLKTTAIKLSDEVNKKWTTDAVDSMLDVSQNKDKFYIKGNYDDDTDFDNALSYILSFPETIKEYLNEIEEADGNIKNTNIIDDIKYFINGFNKYNDSFKEWLVNNYKELKETPAKELSGLIRGYDLSDFAIDVDVLLKYFNTNNMISDTGAVVDTDSIRAEIERLKNIGSYELYGNLGSKPLIINTTHGFWANIKSDELGFTGTTDDIVKVSKEKGYTSVVFEDIMDMAMNNYSANIPSDVYVFFSKNQVKSADLVTFDDDGNIIPLSKRFTNSDDIRENYL